MNDQPNGTNESLIPGTQIEAPEGAEGVPIEDWAAAFAALEDQASTSNLGTDTGGAGQPASGLLPEGQDADAQPGTNPALGEADGGGYLSLSESDGGSDYDRTPSIDVDEELGAYQELIEDRALEATSRLFAEQTDDSGNLIVRQTNGVLGATINDDDIYRVDRDGVPGFFNPDTGRQFTGDNPRAQAMQWVEMYNQTLRDTFNQVNADLQAQYTEEYEPSMDMIAFVPTYERLDLTRQQMLEALISDYEILDDDGETLGYSCDLDQALEQVNRQVQFIKSQYDSQDEDGDNVVNELSEPASGGPVFDIPSGSSATQNSGAMPDFKSVAEAMEYAENKKLADRK